MLLITLPYQFNLKYLTVFNTGSDEGSSTSLRQKDSISDHHAPMTVLKLFDIGRTIIFPMFAFSWIYTVVCGKKHVIQFLNVINQYNRYPVINNGSDVDPSDSQKSDKGCLQRVLKVMLIKMFERLILCLIVQKDSFEFS